MKSLSKKLLMNTRLNILQDNAIKYELLKFKELKRSVRGRSQPKLKDEQS